MWLCIVLVTIVTKNRKFNSNDKNTLLACEQQHKPRGKIAARSRQESTEKAAQTKALFRVTSYRRLPTCVCINTYPLCKFCYCCCRCRTAPNITYVQMPWFVLLCIHIYKLITVFYTIAMAHYSTITLYNSYGSHWFLTIPLEEESTPVGRVEGRVLPAHTRHTRDTHKRHPRETPTRDTPTPVQL